MSTLKKFAGQTAIYGLSTVLSRLLNSILTPIYVKLYPTKLYGIFVTMYAWASVLNAVLAFGMETTFFRYLNKSEDKEKVYSTTFFSTVFISLLFLGLTFPFTDQLAQWMHADGAAKIEDYKTFIRLFIGILILDALAVIPSAKIRAEGRPGRYAVIKTINILCTVALNLFFLFVIPWGIKNGYFELNWFKPNWVGYVFISNLLASLITFVLLIPELTQLKLQYDKKLIIQMLSYSFPILIANLSFIVNENLDKIAIKQILGGDYGDQEVGIYGAACKMAIFLSIFIQAFRLGAEPFFFSHAKSKNSGTTYATIMNYFVIVVCFIFAGIIANIEILKYFIHSGSASQRELYWSGLQVVPVLLFGYVSLGIYMNLSIWYKLSDQTRFGLYISGIGAVLTIVLNIIFIPKYSYVASAWISLTAYFTMMVLSYVLGQKNYPIPYNLKKILGYMITSIVIVFLSFNIFNRSLIAGNILLVLFAAGILYVEKNNFKAILSKK